MNKTIITGLLLLISLVVGCFDDDPLIHCNAEEPCTQGYTCKAGFCEVATTDTTMGTTGTTNGTTGTTNGTTGTTNGTTGTTNGTTGTTNGTTGTTNGTTGTTNGTTGTTNGTTGTTNGTTGTTNGTTESCMDDALFGEPCGVCDSGTWTCFPEVSNLLVCEGEGGFNPCTGCTPLPNFGEPCGNGGTLTCAGTDSLQCEGSTDTNRCGGTTELEHEPGESCGTCEGGEWTCDGEENVTCVGDEVNACGECGEVPEEICDGTDNDCDDQIDEGLLNACGECAHMTPIEICNDIDDDCDGEIDEDVTRNECGGCLPLDPTLVILRGDSCAEQCDGDAVWTCSENNEAIVCMGNQGSPANPCGGCGPVPEEVCDGMDNDCDGLTDENVTNACGGCGPVPEEVCDGEDNDCDGIFDEGVGTNACGGCTILNPIAVLWLGESCAECGGNAVWACTSDNEDIACTGDPGSERNACGGCGPVPEEVCDNLDNDCDDEIDEDDVCVCTPTGEDTSCNGEDEDCDGFESGCEDGVRSEHFDITISPEIHGPDTYAIMSTLCEDGGDRLPTREETEAVAQAVELGLFGDPEMFRDIRVWSSTSDGEGNYKTRDLFTNEVGTASPDGMNHAMCVE